MKPLLLTLQAFGPYADRQQIDFLDAIQSGLFGIYGQTGSGKSSIFSAMTFALFGEPANAEQDASSLRSDHADPAVLTEVEFVFDLGPKRYLVRRRPEQMRPKGRGDGETRQAHEAWLFDATGIALEDISQTNPGTPLAERKVGLVKEVLSDLLGYGGEQFRQIVLLPQGRFETFLSAKTDARLRILRELFDVSLYRRLTHKLKEEAASAVDRVRTQRQVIEQRLQHDGFDSFEALDSGIEAGDAEVAQSLESRRAAQGVFDEERKKLDSAKQVEARFAAAELAQSNLEHLILRADQINEVRAQVGNARRAEALLDVEAQVIRAQADVCVADDHVGRKQLALETAEGEVAAAGINLVEVRARAGEIDSLRQACDRLGRFETKLSGTSALAAALAAAQTVLDEKSHAQASAATTVADLKAKKESDAAKLVEARRIEGERAEMTVKRARLEGLYQGADIFGKACRAVEEAQRAHDRTSERHRGAQEQTSTAKIAMDLAEQALASTQALHLAGMLVEGEPCPVCGSENHPHPAVGDVTREGLDGALRVARRVFEQAQAEDIRLAGELGGTAATLVERQTRRDGLTRPEDKAATYLANLTIVKGQIEALPAPADIPAQAAAFFTLDDQINAAEDLLEIVRRAFAGAERDHALAQKELDLALAEIPEDLRTAEALDEAKSRSLAALTERIAAQRAAEERLNKAKEDQAAGMASAEAALHAQSETVARRDRDAAGFHARLASAGFSIEQFAAVKPLIAAMPTNAQKVEQYDRDLGVAAADVVDKGGAIDGVERPDLELLVVMERTADLALQAAVDANAQAAQALESKSRLKADLLKRKTELETFERATAELRDLASMLSGNNAQRTDLETFAIGAMFDQVLSAANLRLRPMTSSRYSLERDGEGSGNARRGLGIRVNDTYTGKGRSPATLSGGETFICALALALGLSDIVESASGKIRLDTIFIDEGFGSLDTENDSGTLNQVLQVLTHLAGHRRSVGVISHVPQVQEMIPNGFYVRKGLTGSVIEPRGNV